MLDSRETTDRIILLYILDYIHVKQKGRQTFLCRMAAGIPEVSVLLISSYMLFGIVRVVTK